MFREQLLHLCILDTLLRQPSLERSAHISCADARGGDHNGVRCACGLVWCGFQITKLFLQEHGQIVQLAGIAVAGAVIDRACCSRQSLCVRSDTAELTGYKLVFEFDTAQVLAIQPCSSIDIVRYQLAIHALESMVHAQLLIQIILVDVLRFRLLLQLSLCQQSRRLRISEGLNAVLLIVSCPSKPLWPADASS